MEAKELQPGKVKTDDQVAIRKTDRSGGLSERHVPVSLSAVQQIADREGVVFQDDEELKEALLLGGDPRLVLSPANNLCCAWKRRFMLCSGWPRWVYRCSCYKKCGSWC